MSGYVFLFFGSLDMTKNSFSLQDERNDKVLDKERMFEDSRGGGGGGFSRNSSAASVWVLKNKFPLSSELKWKKKATGNKNEKQTFQK